ncbi:flagellar basal body L-ring protein FlgH [Thiopseudomonas denitrificans]|jgi:flagellar L-ring protein precursor FlgH|uniref:Flagellar L-ring protein n=1 Tax=Thiopseudomonas denitrificans TaxID=1501432 RepID=A0A4R6TX72_9GAMM|nr:flagellar basal body L-ring protein FlgH [Thiopseudomonas denitrificans]TDQ38478.1 flagellar L-ring protein precursor FlgH [Thiopseudomonas denitrificans]
MKTRLILAQLTAAVLLSGCMQAPPKPNDPYYAPVVPRVPMPAEQNMGAIYQPSFESNYFTDRKAFRVGDIITINLNERMQASKNASSTIQKDSDLDIGVPNILGMAVSPKNPLSGISALGMTNKNLSLEASANAKRSTKGSGQAGQSNSLAGSITVTVADVLPNGVLVVRGEKWLTLNTGDELIRISGLVRPDDISTDNTVSSTRIADARITYSGTGTFANASQPGWLSRFFMSPVWPF